MAEAKKTEAKKAEAKKEAPKAEEKVEAPAEAAPKADLGAGVGDDFMARTMSRKV